MVGTFISRRSILQATAGLCAVVPAIATSSRASAATAPVTVVDTVSGPNFQAFWTTYLIPKIRKDLGIEIRYSVGSGPTLQLQMQNWRNGEPGFSLMFLKDLDLSNMVKSGLKFDTLYPGRAAQVPNEQFEPKPYQESSNGVPLKGSGLLFWRAEFGLIYNAAFVKAPPKTWAEMFDRRKEFSGHIGMVRTDASSGGGRAFMYSFLLANGVDFKRPFAEIQASAAWKNGLSKFTEFSHFFAPPIASAPPVMFHQFQTEQVWMTSYAQDYSLWSSEQGQLPPTIKASPLDVNIVGSSNAYLAVPAVATAAQKANDYKVINLLLSNDVQNKMLETMYEYPGTNAWRKAPASAWTKIAPVDVALAHGAQMNNYDAITYIQQHGMDYIAT